MILRPFVYTLRHDQVAWSSGIPYSEVGWGNTDKYLFDLAWSSDVANFRNVVNFSGWYLELGTSNAPEEYESGALVEPITDLTGVEASTRIADGEALRTVVATFRNDTENTFVVREIGIGISGIAFSSNYAGGKSILARKVLSTPINFEPHQVYTFSYAIKAP